MNKFIIYLLALLFLCFSHPKQLFGQENVNFPDLTKLFNENDYTPTTISNRYTQFPDDVFSHAQIMNIPASNQAVLLHKVLIIVDSTLYSELSADIDRYAHDIHHVYGCNVIMEWVVSETCQDIKNLILSYQNNLDGCVFVGDIVPALYRKNDFCYHNHMVTWPCDLYYMDLTGIWTDGNHDNFFDGYSGDMKPEIFVGRISTANMGNLIEEIEGMRLYLKKNHKYWIGHRHINKKYGLSYTDTSWQDLGAFSSQISYLYGASNKESYTPDGYSSYGKTDFLRRLRNNKYEFVQLAAHSHFYCHVPINEYTNDTLFGNELYNNTIKALGFNLFCCSACCWTDDSQPNHAFLAGDYIYSPYSDGLSAVGSTKTGGMYDFWKFYSSLGQGKTMGQALEDWWRNKDMTTGNADSLLCWNFGLTIIGDPLVNFFHCTNSTCQNQLTLTSYNTTYSPLSYYLTSEKITVSPPSSGSFSIPVGDHCILNSPIVEIYGAFNCPQGATLEILSEGCQDNCDD